MTLTKSDFIGILAIALMLIGASLLTYYYTTSKINSCTTDPLKFTADKLSNGQNYSYVSFYIYKYKSDYFPMVRREIDLTDYSNFTFNN